MKSLFNFLETVIQIRFLGQISWCVWETHLSMDMATKSGICPSTTTIVYTDVISLFQSSMLSVSLLPMHN